LLPLLYPDAAQKKIDLQDTLSQSIEEIDYFKLSRKYKKAGIHIVYLTGSPYEIGLAHEKLCKNEILTANNNSVYKQLRQEISCTKKIC
jgi:hypothetical protein